MSWIATLGIVVGGIAALAVVALGIALAISPAKPSTPLESVRTPFVSQDYRDLPPPQTYPARDGQALTYRFYSAAAPKVAVLIHGSSGGGISMHALARALAQQGVAQVYTLDIRGHGASGAHGDIGYVGQLEDDLEDFLGFARPKHAGHPFVLAGFSSGGGFTLRIAGGRLGDKWDAYVLLSPFLRYDAPTQRPAGGWASASTPRIVALALLDRLHLPWFQGLTVIEYAVNDADRAMLTSAYSYRLQANFAAHWDYTGDFRRISKPAALLAGAEDELFYGDRFAALVQPLAPTVHVEVVAGVNHAGLVTKPAALAAIGRAVARLP